MRLLYLSMVSFVFIATCAVTINKVGSGEVTLVNVSAKISNETSGLPPIPMLKSDSSFPILSAQAVYVVDLDTGVTLYEKNPDTKFLPASTTKIVTSLVALDHYKLNQILTVTDPGVIGQKMRLVNGEKISVENLLYGLLVFSANDAAEVLAKEFPGGRDEFIAQMNNKAAELNMKNSYFVNPTGLDGAAQLTTARDLAMVSIHAMENPVFRQMVGTKTKTVTNVDGQLVHPLRNINQLLGTVEGVKGVKTGWTENARENLVTYLDRDGRQIMIALLGSQDRFGETRELIDWIGNSYQWVEVYPPETVYSYVRK